MNLRYIERVNRITEKIVELRLELRERERGQPNRYVGGWRHQYNIDLLRARVEYLEQRRLALFDVAPKVMKSEGASRREAPSEDANANAAIPTR